MRTWSSFAPAILGVFVVMQAALNRRIAALWGIPSTAFFNAIVLVSIATVFLLANFWRADWFPENFRPNFDVKTFAPWFFLPGLCGFAMVVGGPLSVARWGALHTFLMVVSAQLVASAAWDYFSEGIPLSRERIFGMALAWSGVFLASRGR